MKTNSQNMRVLQYIKEHGSITSMEAFTDLRITRLSGRIFDLKQLGHAIVTDYEFDSDGNRYGVYHFEEVAHV